jgi:uncharacterized protein YndB with AHSA1/START domain
MTNSPSAERGFLVVADITGYTSYLSRSELEHAKDVLKTLLDLLIDYTRPPLALSGLEGDAVLSYAVDSDRFEGQAFVEMIEQTYVAFKRAIDLMVMNTSCTCNACANINALDLKFFVHHGEFVLQEFAGREELVGSDVNLIHRLMKNTIVEETGFLAYTYFTEAATDRLGLEGITAELTGHAEAVPDIGNVRGWVMDMAPIWETSKATSRLEIDEQRTVSFVEEYPLPPEQVWGYLTNPRYRSVFSNAKRQVTHDRRNGRVGPGTVYECFHMDNSISTNTVLEWQPFSRIVTDNTAARSSRFLCIFDIEPTETGTRVTMRYGPMRGPLIERAVGIPLFFLKYKRLAQQGMTKLRLMMEDDLANGQVFVPEYAVVTPETRDAAAEAAVTDLPNG